MTTKYYQCEYTGAKEFAIGLPEVFGEQATIYFQDYSYCVFSCPPITNKVIRTGFNDNYPSQMGDEYASGSKIKTNIVKIGAGPGSHMVISDNFALVQGAGAVTFLLGKLTNGEYVIGGTSGFWNSSTMESIHFLTFAKPFKNPNGKIFMQPIHFIKNTGEIITNPDGSFATIPGLYNVSHPSVPGFVVNENYIMSATTGTIGGIAMANSLHTPLYVPLSLGYIEGLIWDK